MTSPVRTAFVQMVTARLASIVLMAVSFALLGRLLPSASFGEFAVAMAAFATARSLAEFGLRPFLIRERSPDPELVASAIGLSLALSTGLCVVGISVALVLEGLVLGAGVTWALVLLSLALVVDPFILAAEAMRQRALDFRLLAVIEVLRTALDGGTAVVLALLGFGAPALAAGVLASRVVAAVVLLMAGTTHRMLPRFSGWTRFGGFGLRFLTVDLLPNLGNLILVSILSVVQGAAVAGLFNRSDAIRQMIDRTLLEGVRPVVLPVMGRQLREGSPPSELYAAKIDYLAAICWPGFGLIALLAGPLVAVLLGPDWEAAVLPVGILALTGLAVPFTKMSAKFFIATDLMDDNLRIQVTQQLLRIALVGGAALVSLRAFCVASVVTSFLKAWRLEQLVVRRLGRLDGMSAVWRRNLAVTGLTLVGPAVVASALRDAPAAAILGAAVPLAIVGWLGGLAVTGHRLLPDLRALARWPVRAPRQSS